MAGDDDEEEEEGVSCLYGIHACATKYTKRGVSKHSSEFLYGPRHR